MAGPEEDLAAGAEGLEPLVELAGAGEAALSPEPLSPEALSGDFLSEEPELDSELEDPDEEPADSLDRGRLSVL